jgi:hypothetical protein
MREDSVAAKMFSWNEHQQVLDEAQTIYEERDKERGDLWLDDGRDKMVEMAYDKALRVRRQVREGLAFNEDDLLDLINYAAFAIRCNRRGRIEREEG